MNFFKTFKPFIAFIFPSFFLISCAQTTGIEKNWLIDNVHDGDTFDCGDTKIRLFGVDTPEMNDQYNNFEPTTGIERLYAIEATNFAKKRILGKHVHVTKITIDQYKRIIAKITTNEDLGTELIRAGLARVAYISLDKGNPFYSNDYEYYEKLLKAQHLAYIKNVGIWAHKDVFKKIFPKA